METKITRASNGRGIAAQSTVEVIRAPGNMILDLTTTQNFPGVNESNTVSGEIFHFACWTADGGGVLVPGTLVEGKAHVSNIGEVTIDSLDPGFTDKGNNIGDIFMVKPTTGWANDMVEALQATLNPDGTLKDNSVTTAAVANNAITTPKLDSGAITADKLDYTTLAFGNYSTTEQDTGFKWIDGKTIYKKTFTGTLTAAANVRLISTISSFPSVKTMVKAEGWFNGGGEIVMFGSLHVSSSGIINRAMAIRGDNQLITWSDTARTNAPYAFTIYYTKA